MAQGMKPQRGSAKQWRSSAVTTLVFLGGAASVTRVPASCDYNKLGIATHWRRAARERTRGSRRGVAHPVLMPTFGVRPVGKRMGRKNLQRGPEPATSGSFLTSCGAPLTSFSATTLGGGA